MPGISLSFHTVSKVLAVLTLVGLAVYFGVFYDQDLQPQPIPQAEISEVDILTTLKERSYTSTLTDILNQELLQSQLTSPSMQDQTITTTDLYLNIGPRFVGCTLLENQLIEQTPRRIHSHYYDEASDTHIYKEEIFDAEGEIIITKSGSSSRDQRTYLEYVGGDYAVKKTTTTQNERLIDISGHQNTAVFQNLPSNTKIYEESDSTTSITWEEQIDCETDGTEITAIYLSEFSNSSYSSIHESIYVDRISADNLLLSVKINQTEKRGSYQSAQEALDFDLDVPIRSHSIETDIFETSRLDIAEQNVPILKPTGVEMELAYLFTQAANVGIISFEQDINSREFYAEDDLGTQLYELYSIEDKADDTSDTSQIFAIADFRTDTDYLILSYYQDSDIQKLMDESDEDPSFSNSVDLTIGGEKIAAELYLQESIRSYGATDGEIAFADRSYYFEYGGYTVVVNTNMDLDRLDIVDLPEQ